MLNGIYKLLRAFIVGSLMFAAAVVAVFYSYVILFTCMRLAGALWRQFFSAPW